MSFDVIAELKCIIREWKTEGEFLTTNSRDSDILVGNTYNACAKRLEELLEMKEGDN